MPKNSAVNGYTAAALGNFDGLHKGHLRVLEKTLETAKEKGLVPAVILFDKHPKLSLEGKRPPFLTEDSLRDEMLSDMGFRVIKISFDENRNLSPEAFVEMLADRFSARVLCCGFNYRCGKDGAGDAASLKKICEDRGLELFALPAEYFEGEPVSSTRIRNEIENGRIGRANAMLGRFFSYKLKVEDGDKRGRVLGYPTINQRLPENFAALRFGVYASFVKLGEKRCASVTNIGIRPTIGTKTPRSETYIIGFSGNLYGERVEVSLLEFIRDEKKFESLEALSKTIAEDAETAKKIYEDMVRQNG